MITGINMIRNGIENGYPFVESILSALPLVDEYLMNDGGSTDGTYETLRRMEELFPKIKVYQIPDVKSVRWDCVSDVINRFIKEAKGDWIFLGNADELLHERDIPNLKTDIEHNEHLIMRFDRREIIHKWSQLTKDYYPPARVARNKEGLRQDWSGYGGDEFLYGSKWIDPDRKLKPKYLLYHLYAVFPHNMLNKRRNDAEWLAPGAKKRVEIYEQLKGSKFGSYQPPDPNSVYPDLPALAKGLVPMGTYEVREELFDHGWLWETTGLIYD